MTLVEAVLSNPRIGDTWSRWVVTDRAEPARRTCEFLEVCLANIPEGKKRGFTGKLRLGDVAHVEATLHELVAHELLLRLKLQPESEPSIDQLTPDLGFRVAGAPFIADVIVVHSPTKTICDHQDGTGEARDTSEPSESRAKKIADLIAEKAHKYNVLSYPLVVLAFLGDRRILSSMSFEQALFGRTTGEASPCEFFPNVGRAPILLGGLLLPDDSGAMPHRNLSAVVVLDWFDTLNRNDPGKRLHCVVLHHWDPKVQLPAEAFEPFPQIAWERKGLQAWAPQSLGHGSLVAKFDGRDGLQFAPYSPNRAW